MPRLDQLSQIARNNLLTFPAQVNETAPFVRLTKALSACRLAIVTTAGLHRRRDRLFTPGDQSYRVIASDTPTNDIIQSHTSIGFDRVPTMRDVNISFPIDRLRELIARGELGELGPSCYSFMGAQREVARIESETGPEVGRRLRDEGVDVALITPTWPNCTHTGGVLARTLEQVGVATTSISLVREHTEKVKPPRALFVPFPFGMAFGRPDDPELQHRVLRGALDLLAEPTGPVLRDLSSELDPGDQPGAPPQASGITPAAQIPEDVAMETTQMRRYHERWLEKNGGRTHFGLAGIPATRFRGVVRFLEGFAEGQDLDMAERPADVPLPNFIRYCADDLKALYFEGHLAMKPAAGGEEIARWFWGETGAGRLLRSVRDRLDASTDPRWKAAAFGVAR